MPFLLFLLPTPYTQGSILSVHFSLGLGGPKDSKDQQEEIAHRA